LARVLGVAWLGSASLLALALPLLLVAILFMGPLSLLLLRGKLGPVYRLRRLGTKLRRLTWWRNLVVGPLSEELVFRACMLPLLLAGGWTRTQAALISPLLFGLAHGHHLLSNPRRWRQVLLQLGYTSLFGAFSAALQLRTGHLLAAFATHAFCNAMGFPRLDRLAELPPNRQMPVRMAFLTGLVSFIVLLEPLTRPALYSSVYFGYP
jgi:prenyl protein peptidase